MWCFHCANLTKPYHCVRVAQKVSQQSVPSIINKRHTILTKRLYVAIAIIGAFLYRVYLRMFNPFTSNPSTFLGLCYPVDKRQCIKSPMGVDKMNSTEKTLTLTICDCIRSKKVLFYPNFTFANINIELRQNVPTSQRSNIEQERSGNLTLGQSTFCRPGGVPIKKCEIA